MAPGDKVIRFVTALAVFTVAAIAAVVSYSHIYDLARTHGQSGTAARLLPLSVDGLILAASLVLLQAARNGQRAPALARTALWLGIGSTVAANLAYGLPFGPVGAVVSAWPGVAFVLAAEILLGMLRVQPGCALEDAPEIALAGEYGAAPGVPEDDEARTRPARALSPSASHRRTPNRALEVVFRAEIEAGELPSIRAIKRRMSCGQDRAKVIRGHLAALLSDVPETIEAVS